MMKNAYSNPTSKKGKEAKLIRDRNVQTAQEAEALNANVAKLEETRKANVEAEEKARKAKAALEDAKKANAVNTEEARNVYYATLDDAKKKANAVKTEEASAKAETKSMRQEDEAATKAEADAKAKTDTEAKLEEVARAVDAKAKLEEEAKAKAEAEAKAKGEDTSYQKITTDITQYEKRLINKKKFIDKLKNIIIKIIDEDNINEQRDSLFVLLNNNTDYDDVPNDFKNYIIGEIMIMLFGSRLISIITTNTLEVTDEEFKKTYELAKNTFKSTDFESRHKNNLLTFARTINELLI